ncbi:hypothetical protein [Halomonas sp. M20]|uniref:hypothetical protein n=1 Tax=Halomonas sp. M20 TaxID=2763264 RepID=UPI001D09B697|nr:hypothetical protein [Halomonas sp. M20]
MTRKFGWSKNVLVHQIAKQELRKNPIGPVQAQTPEQCAQVKLMAFMDEHDDIDH